tara:strand:- start:10244 stop:10360 length:117 start_codon:yes stop_codon:yes gene_type:complete
LYAGIRIFFHGLEIVLVFVFVVILDNVAVRIESRGVAL